MKRLFIVMAVMLMTGQVVAQTNKGRQVNLREIKKLSVGQMLQKGQRLAADNSEMYSKVLNMMSDARRKGDNVKVRCLRNIVPAMKGLVRIGQQSLLNLKELSATGDRMDAESQFVKIVISNQKMMELYDMANQCGTANVKQIFEKGVHVEKEVLPGVSEQDVVEDSSDVTPEETEPFEQTAISSGDRFVLVDQGSVVPASDFY